MKIKYVGILLLTLAVLHLGAQDYQITDRGPDFRLWTKTTVENGTSEIHSFVELASGICYTNDSGQLVDSVEQISLLPGGGAAATQGLHQVYFPADIYNGVLEVVTPDGKHLKSRPLGVSYDDGSNTVWIARLQHSTGELINSNQVMYPDAFTGFHADLVCTYRKSGFESDLVCRESPATPDHYGLNNASTTMQLVTEFFGTADPQQVRCETNKACGLQDRILKFGALTMTKGKAFFVADTNSPSANAHVPISVYKTWMHASGRSFLIEEVPLTYLADALSTLPESTNSLGSKVTGKLRMASGQREWLPSHKVAASAGKIRLASRELNKRPGLVLDYDAILTDQTDFTFESGTTYLIAGQFNLSGTTTLQGGAVIKYDTQTQYSGGDPWSQGANLNILGDLACDTDPGHPAIFTDETDNSVGETILPGATPITGAGLFFNLESSTANGAHDLRMSYADSAITVPFYNDFILVNCQFLHCNRGILDRFGDPNGYNYELNNVLFGHCLNAILVSESTCDNFIISNVTADVTSFWDEDYNVQFVTAINSILGGDLGNLGNWSMDHTATNISGIFVTNGMDRYYLNPASSCINAGNTTADQLGFYHLTTQTNQVPETNSVIDLGYHYVAADAGGNPLDSNGDGVPDYIEDANGNGLVDTGETNWALAILTQPVSQTVIYSNNATLGVTAGGINPIVYQWYFNGTNLLAGDTNASLTLTHVEFPQTGLYSVIVSNAYGSITSSNAQLVLSNTMTVGFGNDVVGQCDVPIGLTNALLIAGGGGQSLALKTDGTVVGWGQNYYGEATPPANLAGATTISAGWYHSVALLTNGMVVAWGIPDSPLFGNLPVTNVPSNLTNATMISAQALHTLALRSDGTVVAWGYNGSGETNIPAGLRNVTGISAGYQFNLAVSNGFVVAWGNNGGGQCNVPTGLSNVVEVAAGLFHSLALLQNGTVLAWGSNAVGEINVPFGLTNVVAIAASGDPDFPEGYTAYSMALKSDGTVVLWGDDDALNPVNGLTHVTAIAAGADHALAIRSGPLTPVLTFAPSNEFQLTNGTATFSAIGEGLYGVTYQWQTNGVNIAGATNDTLMVTSTPLAAAAAYAVVVRDNGGMGSITSSNAYLSLVTSPIITSASLPAYQFAFNQSNVTLNVSASAPGILNGFPLSYQWQFDGTNISGAISASYTFSAVNSGTYSVIIANAAGTVTNSWQVDVVLAGSVLGWGADTNGELTVPLSLTNAIALAAGLAHGVAALDNGTVSNWGAYWTGTGWVSATAAPFLTNAIAVAAGSRHDLALEANGTLTAWGYNDFGQTNVPGGITNAVAVAAGGQQSLALLHSGLVVQWGQTNGAIPAGLTNATAIAAGTNFAVALQNSTVVAWGANDQGQTNVPAGLTNVVAIAAGGKHALALEQNGTVVAWGAWTNVPADLTNAMYVAAGENHNIAVRNDGTVVCWGDNTFGQTNTIGGLQNVKLIAGGGDFTLAAEFSPTVMYSIDVTKDLLLLYNTNSHDSTTVLNYYLANRPGVSNANVLGIAFDGFFITNSPSGGGNWISITNTTVYETISPAGFTNQILNPLLNWLTANPAKRPQYLILMPDVPTRVYDTATNSGNFPFYPGNSTYGSTGYQITKLVASWLPFVTHINMNGTNDCIGYIKKISRLGIVNAFNGIILSASAGGYGNTNWYFDDSNNLYPAYTPGLDASNAVCHAAPSTGVIKYIHTNDVGLVSHITYGFNLSGYMSWGSHSTLGAQFPTNGEIEWSGPSGWWLLETIESYNGQRYIASMSNFILWYSSNAFGGTDYSNTPVGAICSPDEPFEIGVSPPQYYFGSWASGKNFAICAWSSPVNLHLVAIGDPFIIK